MLNFEGKNCNFCFSGGGNQKFSGLMGQQAPEPQVEKNILTYDC